MITKKYILLFLFIAITKQQNACSCDSRGSFLEVAYKTKFVALVKVLKYKSFNTHSNKTPLTMEVEIINRYIGEEKKNKIVVWGDNGIQCKPYVSNFKIGDYYIIAFDKENQNDYTISNCGEFWLTTNFKTKEGFGNFRNGLKSLSFEIIKKRLKENLKFELKSEDYRSIYQSLLDYPKIQQYYHLEKDTSRKQLYIIDRERNGLKDITKFGSEVKVLDWNSIPNKTKNYFEIRELYIEKDYVRLEAKYEVEGLYLLYEFQKKENNWIVVSEKTYEQ
jgi:hypothetical protein